MVTINSVNIRNLKKEILKEVDKKYIDYIFECYRAIHALSHCLETAIFHTQNLLKEKQFQTAANYMESADEITLAIQGQCRIIDKKLSDFIKEIEEEDEKEEENEIDGEI